MNSMFRAEGVNGYASDYIRDAVAITRWRWSEIPVLGMVSFVDPKHVKPRMVRGRPTWGQSYLSAGFRHVGYTKGGLWTFQMLPADMPEAITPAGQGGLSCPPR